MVLEELAQGLLDFVNWGITLLVLMLIWEIWKFISFGGTVSTAGGFLGGKLAGAAQWVADIPKRRARNTQKKALNEWISEEEEEKDLDLLRRDALHILTEFEAVANRGELSKGDKDNFDEMLNDFGELLTKTKRNFRQLTRNTSRADNGLDKMLDYFKKKGIRVPDEIKALENNILKLHHETGSEIAKVEEVFQRIMNSPAMTAFKNIKEEDFASAGGNYKVQTGATPFNRAHLELLIRGFRDERFLLEEAYRMQAEAKKEMTGIIQETRSLYQ